MTEEFTDFVRDYTSDDVAKDEIDYLQETFRCCGVTNATDWATTGNMTNGMVPDSCCFFNSTITNGTCTEKIVYANDVKGCVSLLNDVFFDNLDIIGGVGLAFACLQLLALGPVCYFLVKRQSYEVF